LLNAKAAEWVRLGQGSSGLLDEIQLREAEDWLGSPEAAYLGYDAALLALVEASRARLTREQARARRRTRRVIAALVVVLVVVTGLAIWGAISAHAASQEARRAHDAEAKARKSAAQAQEEAARANKEAARANEEEKRARDQAAINYSQRLAHAATIEALSSRLGGRISRLDLSALLSLEAYKAKPAGGKPTVEALGSLLGVLELSPQFITYLRGHRFTVTSVVFISKDGKRLASASNDRTVRLWDLESRRPVGDPLQHGGSVRGLAFSRKVRLLASACGDKKIYLWNLRNPRQPVLYKTFSGRGDLVNCVAFSPDGKTLASGDQSANVRLWDLRFAHHRSRYLKSLGELIIQVRWQPPEFEQA
jgi:hypothetical protein